MNDPLKLERRGFLLSLAVATALPLCVKLTPWALIDWEAELAAAPRDPESHWPNWSWPDCDACNHSLLNDFWDKTITRYYRDDTQHGLVFCEKCLRMELSGVDPCNYSHAELNASK